MNNRSAIVMLIKKTGAPVGKRPKYKLGMRIIFGTVVQPTLKYLRINT